MPPYESELGLGKLYVEEVATGARAELYGIPTIDITTEHADECEPITSPKEISFSIDAKVLDEAMQVLIGRRKTFTGSAKEIVQQIVADGILPRNVLWMNSKQNRTHKKHRIDKKWAKRYGYTCTVYYE